MRQNASRMEGGREMEKEQKPQRREGNPEPYREKEGEGNKGE